jgi:hypothetical protein
MRKFIKYLFVAILFLAISVIAILYFAPRSYVKDGIYHSLTGRFQVPVPVSSSMGGKTNERKGSVSFIDDLCSLYRIDYGAFTEHEKQLLKKMGREKYLSSFIKNVYLDTFLRRKLPEVKIDFKEYLGGANNGTLYAQIDAPKGSVCTVSRNGGPHMRQDAKRGTLVVLVSDRIYVITTGLMQLSAPKGMSLEELHTKQEQDLKDNTMSFAKTITFRR